MDGLCILLVDEDLQVFQEMEHCLEDTDASIIRAGKSTEALRILQKEKVGLLVLDSDTCSMPVQEIVPIVHGIHKDLPIIVTSCRNTPDLEKQIRAQKIFYYHIKSFGFSDLELAMRNALEKQRARKSVEKEDQ